MIHREDQHDQRILLDGVNETITLLPQLDLVATPQWTHELRARYARVFQAFAEQFPQGFLDRTVEIFPLLQRGRNELVSRQSSIDG